MDSAATSRIGRIVQPAIAQSRVERGLGRRHVRGQRVAEVKRRLQQEAEGEQGNAR